MTVVAEPAALPLDAKEVEKMTTVADASVTKDAAKQETKTEEAVVEPVKDVEDDAKADKRKRFGRVAFNSYDSTINVLVSADDVLFTFQQAGLGSLIGGSRGIVGVKAGRYYYEVKVVDVLPSQGQRPEIRLGFSTSTTSLIGGQDGGFLFDILAGIVYIGATSKAHGGKRARVSDVVGVLLNRDATSEQNNTVSLFINGQRATEPQKLPTDVGALFPHVTFKGCSVATHFSNIVFPLSFTVRMLGDAAVADVEKSAVVAPDTPEVVFPIGFDTEEYVKEFVAAHPHFIALTSKAMREWADKSGQKNVACCEDGGKHIGSLMRNRKYIVAMSDRMFPVERKALCARFAGYKKIAKVVINETIQHIAGYANVALPSEDEGFDVIEYVTPKEKCEQILEAWKADCKLRSRVDDLKVGTFFKEQMEELKKLVEEKKKDADAFPGFMDEDYILLNLRAEVHYLLHAFKGDVEDETRSNVSSAHFCYYYKLYTGRSFVFNAYGLGQVEDLLELVSDVMSINEKTMMFPVLEKDVAQTTFFELVEAARMDRQDRLDAGDENAALKFSAKIAQQAMRHAMNKGSNSKGGNKGGKGDLRPVSSKRPASQSWEQSYSYRR
eukprot:GEMP01035621.1.p1 GENE.GEMP01035621.1~~GEMP01035621.1.p1  ORF type:complete len:611 (+),score=156.29 GEMP01035621.1:45-1877(+)